MNPSKDHTVNASAPEESLHSGCSCHEGKGCQEDVSGSNPAPYDYAAEGFGPDGAEIDDTPVPSRPLAMINLSNGSRVEFAAVEEQPGRFGIAIRELGDSERMVQSVLAPMANLPALEIYSRLSPNAPVPRLIAAESENESGQRLVDAVEEPLEADLDELGVLERLQRGSNDCGSGYAGHFCVSGSGWHAFKAFACDGATYPANAFFWCEPNAQYYWRDRWIEHTRRKRSLGITATCFGSAKTQHYYKSVFGFWIRLKTWNIPSMHWQCSLYKGLIKRKRWVRHLSTIQGGPSFVRCATGIYNYVKP